MAYLKNLNFYKNKNVLLLQGPRGPFFWWLKKDLEKAGAKVYKVNFNGGDLLFYPFECINFRKSLKHWRKFLEDIIDKYKIDIVLLFSDWRPWHKIACEVCKRKKIIVGSFEEGYIRPNYVTLELNGVNGYSVLCNQHIDYSKVNIPPKFIENPNPIGNPFWHEVIWAILYYLAANILYPIFPRYRHHKSLYFPFCLYKEALPWIRSIFRKYYYQIKEKELKEYILKKLKNKYFLIPLQVHNDSQVVIHSDFSCVENFIKYVMNSFAIHAKKEHYLVFKHHPRDRGYKDYTKLIKNLAKELRIERRVFYIHDCHLPTFIKNSLGVVLINSTVGTQVLYHKKPLIALGKAIYNIEGLTYKGSL
ncbi:capsule biosynthesis protein, partial [Thermosulfurimonas dismutans]|uniref:capsule biosynthesis protein n=1 Tax=Thermosulfurimonas dismutans TaxID=999894 RepID=UPI0008385907